MKRRSFVAGLVALFAAKKLPAVVTDNSFELEANPEDLQFFERVYQEELHRNGIKGRGSIIGEPSHLREIVAMEPLKKGDIAVIDTRTGLARKAKYESDLILGLVIGPSNDKKYIIAVH